MPSNTSLTPLPYPNPTDAPFVHLDIKALAEATTQGLYVNSVTPPPHLDGRRWHKTDTDRTYISDGIGWTQIAGPDYLLPLTYVGVWGAPATVRPNPMKLFKRGKTVYAVGSIHNTATSVAVGTNIQQPFATLPTEAAPAIDAAITGGNRRLNFPAEAVQSGVGFNLGTFIVADDVTQLMFQPGGASGFPAGSAANAHSILIGLVQWDTATYALTP